MPLYRSAPSQSAQSQNPAQPTESSRPAVSGQPTNEACIQTCMPSCTPQCIRQEPVAPTISEGSRPITGERPVPVIPQGLGLASSQGPLSLMPSQGVAGGPTFINQDEYNPMLVQGSRSTISSQGVQSVPQFSGIVPQTSECVPSCTPACSAPCIRQTGGSSPVTESPINLTPPPAYFPWNVVPATQPTKDCATTCMPQCDAQCIQNQPRTPSVAVEPVPIRSPATTRLAQPSAVASQQPLVTECLPSTIETECICPPGFIVCVTVSGSNQCCRG